MLTIGPRIPIPSPDFSGTAWHYTGNLGLQGIAGNSTLWASSPQVMNDVSEVSYGQDFVKNLWKELREGHHEQEVVNFMDRVLDFDFQEALSPYLFIVSASTKRDLLNQWAHYSGAAGYSIGLNMATLLTIDGDAPHWPRHVDEIKIMPGWYHVKYSKSKQREITGELFQFIISRYKPQPSESEFAARIITARFTIGAIMAQFKHPAFSAEKEIRYIIQLAPNKERLFRTTPDRIIPYVELKPSQKERTGNHDNPPLFEGITLGPNARPGSKKILNQMLQASGHDSIPIKKSKIPYLGSRN